MIAGAIDPKTGTVYIYKEHYENGKSVQYHANAMKNKILNDIPSGRLIRMVADPKGRARSERDMRSLFDHYAEYGIYFDAGINKIEDGIMKVYSYMEMNRFKVFSSCTNTVREHLNYKYPKQDLLADKGLSEKPVDKDNHTCDSIRYLINELPDNPNDLINENYGPYTTKSEKDDWVPHALQDEQAVEEYNWQDFY